MRDCKLESKYWRHRCSHLHLLQFQSVRRKKVPPHVCLWLIFDIFWPSMNLAKQINSENLVNFFFSIPCCFLIESYNTHQISRIMQCYAQLLLLHKWLGAARLLLCYYARQSAQCLFPLNSNEGITTYTYTLQKLTRQLEIMKENSRFFEYVIIKDYYKSW